MLIINIYIQGHGNVYCRYSTVDEAKEARRVLYIIYFYNSIYFDLIKLFNRDYMVDFTLKELLRGYT